MNQIDPQDLVNDTMANFPTEVCSRCGSFQDITPQGIVCDCTRAAAIAKAQVAKPTPEKALEPVQSTSPAEPTQEQPVSVLEALQAIPGAPTPEQIALWKSQCKAVYVFPFDKKEMYVWRPLIYREWQQLKSEEALVRDETKFQEHVVMRAVLWPKMTPLMLNSGRAGLIQTLFSLIMQGSYFVDPNAAAQMVVEL